MKNQGIQHMTISPESGEYMITLNMQWFGEEKVLTEEEFAFLDKSGDDFLSEDENEALFSLMPMEFQEMYADEKSEAFYIIFEAIYSLLRNTLELGYEEAFVLSDKISVISNRVMESEYKVDAAFNVGWEAY